jgi:hypothetical protein
MSPRVIIRHHMPNSRLKINELQESQMIIMNAVDEAERSPLFEREPDTASGES